MKIKRSVLERIVKEEVIARLQNLREADAPPEEDMKVTGADEDGQKKEKKPGAPKMEPASGKAGSPSKPPKKDAKSGAPDDVKSGPTSKDGNVPGMEPASNDEDPADAELDDPTDAPGDEERDAKKSVGDAIAGKAVQSITQEPKSKLIPGAQEITITFNEITDPLKIIVTKNGTVKFWFRGLHDEL